jgi:hypothetical protein
MKHARMGRYGAALSGAMKMDKMDMTQ